LQIWCLVCTSSRIDMLPRVQLIPTIPSFPVMYRQKSKTPNSKTLFKDFSCSMVFAWLLLRVF
jgi:hypothetical protein